LTKNSIVCILLFDRRTGYIFLFVNFFFVYVRTRSRSRSRRRSRHRSHSGSDDQRFVVFFESFSLWENWWFVIFVDLEVDHDHLVVLDHHHGRREHCSIIRMTQFFRFRSKRTNRYENGDRDQRSDKE